MIFCITFGQDHPLRDGWIEINAVDSMDARNKAFETFGRHWSFIYSNLEFNPKYFPLGKIGRTLE
jgi:hypothetical protein